MRDTWRELEAYLRGVVATLAQQPRTILIVSGHWEESVPTVNAGAHPPLLYDHGGFPNYTYRLTFPAPGAPEVAARIGTLLSAAGIASATETRRGWDHGVFVPLKVMKPCADIPVVQLSMQRGLDPAAHLAIGRALRPLRDEGVLILGSRQTYHTMRGFFGGGAADQKAEAIDAWLRATMLDGATRDKSLIRWEDAPHARAAQPHEDHLLPLMVAEGAASGEAGTVDFQGHALGKPISGFRFG
ncbi:aromatic ring-cleaving dioxygenase [Novosphingobium barchaimii LL02]|uniref:Aromatic ring-cleaving dioxygenase n=2 Tax=Novosphingobium barchaimii TaxID=1420591 RepID=A0A0J8A9D2_9SPHN|nr:class III extradiol ring-cleavage dioxygenase [Novosphingobium barchaimii]KMS51910.1 aromatic ring-cleaving dioxygenase [Novosphingobium barchaimii LL02]